MRLRTPLRTIASARHLGGTVVWLKFDDGLEGPVDLTVDLVGTTLSTLRDEASFSRVRVEGGTLTWPGDIDIAPERLYQRLCEQNGFQPQYAGDASSAPDEHLRDVPEISRFFGIVIQMLYADHDPPHFHARYGGDLVSVTIADGRVTGSFPGRALRLVLEWRELHVRELMENWRRVASGEPPTAIPPLE